MNDVLIIILNYNNFAVIDGCLESLLPVLVPGQTVYVIDNGSADDSMARLRQKYGGNGQILFRENGSNLGFAKANNIGIRFAQEKGYQYAMLLNSDTIVSDKDFINKLRRHCEETPRLRAVSPSLTFADGAPNFSFGLYPVGKMLNKMTGNIYLDLKRKFVSRSKKKLIFSVPFVSGACLFIRITNTPQDLLDEDYFFYCEDMQYCRDIKKRHGLVALAKDTTLIHLGGGSTASGSSRDLYLKAERTFAQKSYHWPVLSVYRSLYSLRSKMGANKD